MNASLSRFLAAPTSAPCVVTVDGTRAVSADDDDDEADETILALFDVSPLTESERAALAAHYAAWREPVDERVWFLKRQLEARGTQFKRLEGE